MLKHRIIPCVLLKDWQLVKSINFDAFRTIGHPTSTARVYNARNVDELIVLDIDASVNGEDINLEIITDIAEECFMPLTVGGGIKEIEHIQAVLKAGADKVSINSIALENLNFVKRASDHFGSQCIVCSIDVKKEGGRYRVFNKSLGSRELDPLELAQAYEAHGAGEILLTSVDAEGSTSGYDIELLKMFKGQLDIPIILNGGMGKPAHAVEAIQHGADAVAAAYIFHFSQFTPDDIRLELLNHQIQTRMTNHVLIESQAESGGAWV